jgi:hypothetical protein
MVIIYVSLFLLIYLAKKYLDWIQGENWTALDEKVLLGIIIRTVVV